MLYTDSAWHRQAVSPRSARHGLRLGTTESLVILLSLGVVQSTCSGCAGMLALLISCY